MNPIFLPFRDSVGYLLLFVTKYLSLTLPFDGGDLIDATSRSEQEPTSQQFGVLGMDRRMWLCTHDYG